MSRRFSAADSGKTSELTVKKTFAMIGLKPVWRFSAEQFRQRSDVVQLIVVVAADDLEWFRQNYATEIEQLDLTLVAGGKERVDSVQNALAVVRNDADFVAIHDAARPCVTQIEIDAVFRQTQLDGAAMLATPLVGTVKRVRSGRIIGTVDRTELWEAQTPQVFRREMILHAYEQRGNDNPTDDAQLVEKTGCNISIVPADRTNIKITTQTDLFLAEMILLSQNINSKSY
jgi:2-C-methyl-D-erythritol 4-phosphate cytidylyltransferase